MIYDMFFGSAAPGNVASSWQRLGEIFALDMFLSNTDRFGCGPHPMYRRAPEPFFDLNEKVGDYIPGIQRKLNVLLNLSNFIVWRQTLIPLDCWDPGTAVKDGDMTKEVRFIAGWTGWILSQKYAAVREHYAQLIVEDIETLAFVAYAASGDADASRRLAPLGGEC